jgi:cytochrome bd-type quinol oxidase subunit 1
MQTPAGYEIVDGRFFPTDWLQVIFNPAAAALLTWRALHSRSEVLPFVGGIGLFVLSFTELPTRQQQRLPRRQLFWFDSCPRVHRHV